MRNTLWGYTSIYKQVTFELTAIQKCTEYHTMKRSSQTAIQKRKEQNREAQRKFRGKQAKIAEEQKGDFARLKAQYNLLLAENEVLKRNSPATIDAVSLMEASTPQSSYEQLSPLAHFVDQDSMDLFSCLEEPNWSNSNADQACISDLFDCDVGNLQSPSISPTHISNSEGLACGLEQSVQKTGEVCELLTPANSLISYDVTGVEPLYTQTARGERTTSLLNSQILEEPFYLDSNPVEDYCSNLTNPLGYDNSGPTSCQPPFTGPNLEPDNSVAPFQSIDLVQAIMQIACTQERIARIELEKVQYHTWLRTGYQSAFPLMLQA
jgi:hypothetical protein